MGLDVAEALCETRGVGDAEQVILPRTVTQTDGVATARLMFAFVAVAVGVALRLPVGVALGVPADGEDVFVGQVLGAGLPGAVLVTVDVGSGQVGDVGTAVGITVIVAVGGAGVVGRAEDGGGMGITVGFELGSGIGAVVGRLVAVLLLLLPPEVVPWSSVPVAELLVACADWSFVAEVLGLIAGAGSGFAPCP